MKFPFLHLSAGVPDGWADESTIVYTMPDTLGVGLLPAKSKVKSGAPASVAITWEKCSGTDARRYLEDRLRQFGKAVRGFRLEGQGTAEIAGDAIPFAEFTLDAHTPLVQVLLVRKVDDYIVCVTGTARPAVFPKVREAFLETARSIRREV